MPTQPERVRQLEDDAKDLKNSFVILDGQVETLAVLQSNTNAVQNQSSTDAAVLKHRLDDCVRRLDRSEVSITALLTDIATIKSRTEESHKRIEAWDNRFWSWVTAVFVALAAAIVSLLVALFKK